MALERRVPAPLHEELATDLDELSMLASALPDAPADALPALRIRAVLARRLRDLADVLAIHFDREESGGYLREAVAANPALTRSAEALREQHAALAGRVRDLLGRVEHGELAPLQRELTALVTAIQLHEHGEIGLLQRALDDDIGELD